MCSHILEQNYSNFIRFLYFRSKGLVQQPVSLPLSIYEIYPFETLHRFRFLGKYRSIWLDRKWMMEIKMEMSVWGNDEK